jgi:hypothetical protein
MTSSDSASPVQVITFRGGFTADWGIVARLLDLEARGLRFELSDGGRFRVAPVSVLTAADRAFLIAHRDGVHGIVAYYTGEEQR